MLFDEVRSRSFTVIRCFIITLHDDCTTEYEGADFPPTDCQPETRPRVVRRLRFSLGRVRRSRSTNRPHGVLLRLWPRSLIRLGAVGVLTPEQARDKGHRHLADATNGIDPHAARKTRKARDFETFIREEYGPWFKAHRRTGGMTVNYPLSRFPDLEERTVPDINAWLVEKWARNA